MFDPKEKELLGISNLTVVFGFLNLLKKPTAFYLRLAVILKKKYLFMICVSLLLKENMDFEIEENKTFFLCLNSLPVLVGGILLPNPQLIFSQT